MKTPMFGAAMAALAIALATPAAAQQGGQSAIVSTYHAAPEHQVGCSNG